MAFDVDEELSDADWRSERFSMGLRTSEGVIADSTELNTLASRLRALQEEGLINLGRGDAEGQITATTDGRRLLNYVLRSLFV